MSSEDCLARKPRPPSPRARQARRFAEAIGTNSKTDAVDAAMLARLGAMLEPRALPVHNEILAEMKDLRVARRGLVKDRTATQNQAHQRS